MCELFGLNSRQPAGVRLSFAEFAAHGGLHERNGDGWGVAYYDGLDAHIVREPEPAGESPCVRFLLANNFRSTVVLSHIRHATRGGVALVNTQPFARELMGRLHVFAHNGDLPGVDALLEGHGRSCYHTVGETDSEVAFCALMQRMARLWQRAQCVPPLEQRLQCVAGFAAALRPLGPANFLYSDGDALFAHGDRRTHADGIHAPGLWSLQRHQDSAAGVHTPGLSIDVGGHEAQQVRLLASVPLTDEAWTPLAAGEILVVRDGALSARREAVE